MRALHTSDWHIGKRSSGQDRLQDHIKVFEQIKALAIEEKVDVIINTGDTFDEAFPSIETLQYGWSVMEDLAKIAPLVVICGNHDSAKLLEFMSTIVKDRLQIHFVDPMSLKREADSIIKLPTAAGEIIKIGAIPFIRSANYIRKFIETGAERATVQYADSGGRLETLVDAWLNDGYDQKRDIRVFAAHLLVDGATVSGSEKEFTVQEDFATRSDCIPKADYVAFGHIHKPQTVPGIAHGRYAGSPLQVDFGEVADVKSCYIVSGKPGRALKIETRTLDVGRRLVDIRGPLDGIGAQAEKNAGTLARVFVNLDEPIMDLDSRIKDMLPNVTVCQVKPIYPRVEGQMLVGRETPESDPSLQEMFVDYLGSHGPIADAERVKRYFNELLQLVERAEGEDKTFAEVEDLLV